MILQQSVQAFINTHTHPHTLFLNKNHALIFINCCEQMNKALFAALNKIPDCWHSTAMGKTDSTESIIGSPSTISAARWIQPVNDGSLASVSCLSIRV